MEQQEGPIVLLPDETLEHIASFLKNDGFSSFAPISRRFMDIANSTAFWPLSEPEERAYAGTKLTRHQKYLQVQLLAALTIAKHWVAPPLIVEKRGGSYYKCGTNTKVPTYETPKELLMSDAAPGLWVKHNKIHVAMPVLHPTAIDGYDSRAYEVVEYKMANPGQNKVLKMVREGTHYTIFNDRSWISACAICSGLSVCDVVNALSLEDAVNILGRKDLYCGLSNTKWLFALFKQGEPFVAILVTYEFGAKGEMVPKVEACSLLVYDVVELPSVLGFCCPFADYRMLNEQQVHWTLEVMRHCKGPSGESGLIFSCLNEVYRIAEIYRNGLEDYY